MTEWQRGVPAAGVTGVALYLPYEQLTDGTHGPALTEQLARTFQAAHHPATTVHTACLWRRVVDDEHHPPKEYAATYSAAQKELLLQTLDELVMSYVDAEPVLTEILQGYRKEIASNLPLDV